MSKDINACIFVVSDRVYRGEREDVSGGLAEKILVDNGIGVKEKIVLPNNTARIIEALLNSVDSCDAVMVIGGTGPGLRDQSIDAIEGLAWRTLPGFGEVFRYNTYIKRGVLAVFTRAELFIVGKTPVAVLPGSTDAVELGAKLFAESIPHIIEELGRDEKTPHRHVH